jgi:hypothetical protein
LRLADAGAERLEAACQRALAVGDGRYRTVRGILERGTERMEVEASPVEQPVGAFLRGPAALLSSVQEGSPWPR